MKVWVESKRNVFRREREAKERMKIWKAEMLEMKGSTKKAVVSVSAAGQGDNNVLLGIFLRHFVISTYNGYLIYCPP